MFVGLICKARRLEKRRNDLIAEKRAAWNVSQKQKPKLTLAQKYRRRCINFSRRLCRCCAARKNTCLYRTCFNLKHDGTCENFTLKSIAGFLGGFFLTYIFFMFFVLQLNFKLSTATIMCAVFGSILTIGLAYSYKVRCIVFLVLPQFFSKKGRQALLAYAYILAITGPAKNTLNNMSILGESMACGQEQLKAAVRQILEVIKKPYYAIRDAIKAVIKAIKDIVVKIKEILLTIKRIILSIIKIIKSAFDFIANTMNFCNKEIGTPYHRCQKVFEDAIVDCNAKLGPLFNWLCNITYLIRSVCYIVKILDFICMVVDFIRDIISAIVTRVKQFIRHIRTMFYVRIRFSHSFHWESNHSKSMSEITTGIVTEIRQRSSGLIKVFDFMSSAASLFFIFMIVKVTYYRHKFLTNERFDNKFITVDFRQIDLKRAQLGLETVLPLNHRERQHYITTSSLRLVKKEKSQLSQSAMVLLMATLKLCTHMATDYSLYWIMTLIRYYGRFQSKVEAPNVPTLKIQGEGFLANLLRGIVKAFQPIGLNLEIDTIPCLPDPIPPDYDRYIQIASLLVLCWFLAIFEPYGLRFRHSVMCYYNPVRARERAIWLYNNILRSRSSFLKFARRQLRRKVLGDKSITKITCKEFIRAKLTCRICTWILGSGKQEACLLCGEVFREGDPKVAIRCQTPGCPGIYCEQCFSDLQNLCTVCLDPIQYGDLSDISEEKDSSEDGSKEMKKKKKKKKKKKRKKKKMKIKDMDKNNDSDEDGDDGNDKNKLLKKDKDSDYYSTSGESSTDTEYSYTYQENKDITKADEQVVVKSSFKDVEKQRIPQYASMDQFKDDTDITTDFDSSSSTISEIVGAQKSQSEGKPKVKTRSGSKLSLLNSMETSEASKISTSTSPTLYSRSLESPRKINFAPVKKANSKLSTESIEMEALPSESSEESSRKEYSPHTETTFIITPSTKDEVVQTPSTARFSTKVKKEDILSHSTLISELEDVNEFQQAEQNKQLLTTQPVTKPETESPERIHPDVPNLDLNFKNESETDSDSTLSVCRSFKCTKRNCNCRFFKETVRYGAIQETFSRRSYDSESSSLISEINSPKIRANIIASVTKTKKPSTFSLSQAISPLSIEPIIDMYSPMTSNYPESGDSRNKYRMITSSYTEYDSPFDSTETSSNITEQYENYDKFIDYKFAKVDEEEISGSTEYILGGDLYTGINYSGLRQRRSKEDMYRQRIKDYYKQLKFEQIKNYQVKKPKVSLLKRFLGLFKGKKKNKGIL